MATIVTSNAYGITEIANYIGAMVDNGEKISLNDVEELMKPASFNIVIEDMNRLQSTIMCEQKDSYVQQSQRYVTMGEGAYVPTNLPFGFQNEADSLIRECFNLYDRMCEYTDEVKEAIANGTKKGRPKLSDYKYGIPIEDGRYILPLACKTMVSVSCSGDKLVQMVRTFLSKEYRDIMKEIAYIMCYSVPHVIKAMILDNDAGCHLLSQRIEECYSNLVYNEDPVILKSSFTDDADRIVAKGALTSSSASRNPIEDLDTSDISKSEGIVSRVTGYGHTAILEQYRMTFEMCCSLTAYHQQIRHRLPVMHRETFYDMVRNPKSPVIPKTIEDSPFKDEFLELYNKIAKFRRQYMNMVVRNFDYNISLYEKSKIYPLLLNCDKVGFIMNTNARIENILLKDRLCMTAQWEIRELSMARYNILKTMSKVMFNDAIPPCVHGECKEGKMTCGRAEEVKKLFGE